jgi:peptide/nickel transport system substrate-binding protein
MDHPFGRLPIGAGPFSLADLTDASASLVPAIPPSETPGPEPSGSPSATDSLASPAPTLRPQRPLPYLAGIEMRYFTDPAELMAAYRDGHLDAASGLAPAKANALAEAEDSRLLRYPGATLTAGLVNLAPDHPEFRDPQVRLALLAFLDRRALITSAFDGAAVVPRGLIPQSSVMFDAASSPEVTYDAAAAQRVLEEADWTKEDDGWHLPGASEPLALEVLSPTEEASQNVYAAAVSVVAGWTAAGFATTHVALPPGDFVTERLRPGAFQVAVADVTIGSDPDLYPLLASSQTLEGGSNVMGVQDPALDVLLEAARAPGTDEERKADYVALQVQLAAGRYMLPLAWPDELAVVRDTVEGPTIRQVVDASDRFWDVLTWRLADGR